MNMSELEEKEFLDFNVPCQPTGRRERERERERERGGV